MNQHQHQRSRKSQFQFQPRVNQYQSVLIRYRYPRRKMTARKPAASMDPNAVPKTVNSFTHLMHKMKTWTMPMPMLLHGHVLPGTWMWMWMSLPKKLRENRLFLRKKQFPHRPCRNLHLQHRNPREKYASVDSSMNAATPNANLSILPLPVPMPVPVRTSHLNA